MVLQKSTETDGKDHIEELLLTQKLPSIKQTTDFINLLTYAEAFNESSEHLITKRGEMGDSLVFCLLQSYNKNFGTGGVHFKLTAEQMELRLTTFIALRKKCSIWPSSWNIDLRLYFAFLSATARHCTELLAISTEQLATATLVNAYLSVVTFGDKLKDMFAVYPPKQQQQQVELSYSEELLQILEAERVELTSRLKDQPAHVILTKPFGPAIDAYCPMQAFDVSEGWETQEVSVADGGRVKVFRNSVSMWERIKDSSRESLRLSAAVAETVAKGHIGTVRQYCDQLAAVADASAAMACVATNTAEYCGQMLQQYESYLFDQRARAQGAETTIAMFKDLIDSLIDTIVSFYSSQLQSCLEPAATHLCAVQASGGVSPYVAALEATLELPLTDLRANAAPKTRCRVAGKIAESVFNRLEQAVGTIGKLSEVGAQQLLVDLHAIEHLLRSLSPSGLATDPNIEYFVSKVRQCVYRIESILELYAMTLEQIKDEYWTLFPNEIAGRGVIIRLVFGLKGLNNDQAIALLNDMEIPAMLPPPPSTKSKTDFFSGFNHTFFHS